MSNVQDAIDATKWAEGQVKQTIEEVIEEGAVWRIPRVNKSHARDVIPVNGETEFNDVGLSHGFVHFKDPVTGAKQGFSGIYWFLENATKV